MKKDLYAKLEALQDLLVDSSTGKGGDDNKYKELREELLSKSFLKNKLPDFLASNRTLTQFWPFIKGKFPSYAERRTYLWDSFKDSLEFLEKLSSNPSETAVSEKLVQLDQSYINFEWDKALKRKSDDPEGAITSSRSLIETVCKHILDELKVDYDETFELPKLYKLTASKLKLAPEQHNEQIFKQILGGCQAVVEGLGALRNKLSDSHGKKISTVKPTARHATLAVNLAGTMTSFLLETYESQHFTL